MKPLLVSYDGHNINDVTNYIGTIPRETPLQAVQARTTFIKRAGATPVYAGKELPEAYITILIKCMGTVREQLETINQWFNVYDETPRQLIIKDTEDSDKQYSIYATPRSVSPLIGLNAVRISLARKDPVWKSVTQNSTAWAITASGQTQAITNNGNIEAYPTFEFTPTTYPTGGYQYSRKISFYPTSSNAWVNRPVEIFGGLDTAALVTATKLLSTGNDLRVLVDGIEVDRWFGDTGTAQINQTATKCWIVLDVPAKRETALKTAISNVGVPAFIDVTVSTTNTANITAMPETGRVLIDSEEFTYSAKTITATTLKLTVSARAARNTTAASHSAAAVIRWIPFDIQFTYGNATATAPDIDDTYKPIINLSSSTNASFVYADFSSRKRAGGWIGQVVSRTITVGGGSGIYIQQVDTTPAMGAMIASSVTSLGRFVAGFGRLEWAASFPDGISNVNSSGEKYRYSAYWATTARLYSSIDNVTWIAEWAATEATPASAQTYTTWTHNEVVATTQKYIKFVTEGTTGNGYDIIRFEVTDVTVTLVNYPVTAIRAEESGFYLSATITNTTTGQYIDLLYPLQINQTITIDTDPNQPSAKMNGQFLNIVTPNTNRSNWLPLSSGANTLTFTASSNSNITVTVKHYDRVNFL